MQKNIKKITCAFLGRVYSVYILRILYSINTHPCSKHSNLLLHDNNNIYTSHKSLKNAIIHQHICQMKNHYTIHFMLLMSPRLPSSVNKHKALRAGKVSTRIYYEQSFTGRYVDATHSYRHNPTRDLMQQNVNI